MSHDCACPRYSSDLQTAEDVLNRYRVGLTIAATLGPIAETDGGLKLLQCRICGQFWQESADHCHRRALYQIPPTTPDNWRERPFPDQVKIASLRSMLRELGDEQGPEQCREPGCTRLRVRLSLFCAKHHYVRNLGGVLHNDDNMPDEFHS
ncbi:MAG TPA: hypothetical protein VH475_30005 [Tepidisphaeraceae bacterium]|jgi:hypothetical protein